MTLYELVEKAQAAFDALTPEEQEAHREEQRRSFVYGNLMCSTNHKTTRELVDRVADEMKRNRQ